MKPKYMIGFFSVLVVLLCILSAGYRISYSHVVEKQAALEKSAADARNVEVGKRKEPVATIVDRGKPVAGKPVQVGIEIFTNAPIHSCRQLVLIAYRQNVAKTFGLNRQD